MNPQSLILIIRHQWKRRVPRPRPNLQHNLLSRISPRHLREHRKLLSQPFAVLEEIRRVILVKQVPPFGRVCVEAPAIELGDGGFALFGVLDLREGFVFVIGLDVVPGVEFKDIVAFFEVTGAKLEGVSTFEVVGGIVGAVRGDLGGFGTLGGGGDVGDVCV